MKVRFGVCFCFYFFCEGICDDFFVMFISGFVRDGLEGFVLLWDELCGIYVTQNIL